MGSRSRMMRLSVLKEEDLSVRVRLSMMDEDKVYDDEVVCIEGGGSTGALHQGAGGGEEEGKGKASQECKY